MTFRLIEGDCIEAMQAMDESSVDAIVTDPPYGLEFMGKEWDRLGAGTEHVSEGTDDTHPFRDGTRRVRFGETAVSMQKWHQAWATEALRVLKPGGHLLAFGGTRTYHRLACAIEDAGFEIRDCLVWMYGSGFPKSLDVSKAIDKAAGAERERVGTHTGSGYTKANVDQGAQGRDTWEWAKLSDVPATPDAQRWQGWGTALKPAFEPIVLARKPLAERTVAANVQRYGTGALNVDGCRIEGDKDVPASPRRAQQGPAYGELGNDPGTGGGWDSTLGRWPANVTLDTEAAAMLNGQSRFFYVPKADREERNRGLGGWPESLPLAPNGSPNAVGETRGSLSKARANTHPTVKPVELMQWLVRMVTPPHGTVLDPFTGSGSTGMAALREGFEFVGIEREADYLELARARIVGDGPLFNVEAVT